MSSAGRPAAVIWILLLGVGAALLGAGTLFDVPAADEAPALPADDPAALPPLEVVQAARRGDFAEVRSLLDPPLNPLTGESARRRVLLGLYAHVTGVDPTAVELLSSASDPSGELEDWRLWALASSAVKTDQPEIGRQALHLLLSDHPDSLLVEDALVEATRLAIQQQDFEEAMELLEEGRKRVSDPVLAALLEAEAFALADMVDNAELRREAAIRLLVAASPLADELDVTSALGEAPEGDWLGLLSAAQLADRAEALLAAGNESEAVATLEVVPSEGRDFDWTLHYARALTEAHRGAEAVAALAAATPPSAGDRAPLAWSRAQAAREASRARRGRQNLPSTERSRLRLQAREDLGLVASSSHETGRQVAALRQIYELLSDEERFDPSIDVLHRLRRLSPGDTTGARDLWMRGWREYQRRNHTGAIGYWAELSDLYPESSFARSGRYWSADCYRRLGESHRATAIYRRLASADATDFYSKYALLRLGPEGQGDLDPPPRPTEAWPTDPRLSRARLLSDLGLDPLALTELDRLEGRADPRAWRALMGLALSRVGQHREGIPHLRNAFPELGSPRQATAPQLALRHYYPIAFKTEVLDNSRRSNLPPELVLAMVRQESAFDPRARSWAGARGLMQLMPATAKEWAGRLGLRYSLSRLDDPDFSLRLGTAYFTQVLSMFDGTTELALAGYNGGPYRMKRLWARAGPESELDLFVESLSIEESKTYVKRVLLLADSYRRLYPELLEDS